MEKYCYLGSCALLDPRTVIRQSQSVVSEQSRDENSCVDEVDEPTTKNVTNLPSVSLGTGDSHGPPDGIS